MVSDGYPGAYDKGQAISGVTRAEQLDDVVVFHAGTALDGEQLVTAGGRVLGVAAVGDDLAASRPLFLPLGGA